jgi:hypothetical protein
MDGFMGIAFGDVKVEGISKFKSKKSKLKRRLGY